jgi:transposase
LFPGPITGPQVVVFLMHLQRHLRGKLLVIWDGLPAHRSRVVRDYVAAQRGRLTREPLPGYAPELNPVEYVWGYWKHHELPNLCPKTFGELSHHARVALRRMRRRPTLVAAFWQQAELFVWSRYYENLDRSVTVQFQCREMPMCRNIRTLFNFDPPATEDEIRAAGRAVL